MNVIIDGIEYKPVEQNVEQKVDQEREDAIDAMLDEKNGMAGMHTNRYLAEALYDAGYRKVGEVISSHDVKRLYNLSPVKSIDEWLNIGGYLVTKKVVK